MSDYSESLDCAIGASLAASLQDQRRPSRQKVLPARLSDAELSLEQELFEPSSEFYNGMFKGTLIQVFSKITAVLKAIIYIQGVKS